MLREPINTASRFRKGKERKQVRHRTDMALEQQHAEEEVASHCSDTICKSQLTGWKSISVAAADSEDSQSAGFDCNICLETVQDPVVTLCGHLYCWPCIYRWLEVRGAAASREQHPEPPRCPVCKAKVCASALVPLYGPGRTSKPSKFKEIPRRPFGLEPLSHSQIHSSEQMQPAIDHPGAFNMTGPSSMIRFGGTAASVLDPLVGMIGEMALARVSNGSGTSIHAYSSTYHLAVSSSPRLRRHMMQADESLGRVCFFLFCCMFLCLLLF